MVPARKVLQMDFISFSSMVVSLLVLSLFRGYVFMKGWNWFVSETFGLRMLGLSDAIGLSVVIWIAIARGTIAEKPYGLDGEQSMSLLIINSFLNNGMLLLLLFILHVIF